MAFVDTLLDETEARIVVVDRHDQPGGHWNDAYPFVRLHQPSAYYGVGSRELGRGIRYPSGPNAGGYELATKAAILDYYDQLMQERFLPSGRVVWFPMSEYRQGPDDSHQVTSLLGGARVDVVVTKKLVDATQVRTEAPATHGPRYSVMSQVQLVPVNGLPEIRRPHPCYTVVGAGKTAMDACLWLLANGAAPERIRWIRSRDPWVLDRAYMQPFAENFETTMRGSIEGFRAIAAASSPADLIARLEACGILMRFDSDVEPRAFRAAVLSRGELAQLRRITDVVRLGRVTTIEPTRVHLVDGIVEADPDTLYIDCSASALHQPAPDAAVFAPGLVTLLPTRWAQPAFSAALIAFVESRFADDTEQNLAEKNRMCRVVPYPADPIDWLALWQPTLANAAEWARRPEVAEWVSRSRLNSSAAAERGLDPADPRRRRLRGLLRAAGADAAVRIPHLLAMATGAEAERRTA
jgi:hypothetical protein